MVALPADGEGECGGEELGGEDVEDGGEEAEEDGSPSLEEDGVREAESEGEGVGEHVQGDGSET